LNLCMLGKCYSTWATNPAQNWCHILMLSTTLSLDVLTEPSCSNRTSFLYGHLEMSNSMDYSQWSDVF
jgi:hypothetical protein